MLPGLLGVTDDILFIVLKQLPNAADLLCCALVCTRFGVRKYCFVSSNAGTDGNALCPELLSLAEETARRRVTGSSERERAWVPRRGRESWLGLLQELDSLRRPLVFARAHPSIICRHTAVNPIMCGMTNQLLTNQDYRVGNFAMLASGYNVYCTAATVPVMRAGVHRCEFTMVRKQGLLGRLLGVITPTWDVLTGSDAFLVDGREFPDMLMSMRTVTTGQLTTVD